MNAIQKYLILSSLLIILSLKGQVSNAFCDTTILDEPFNAATITGALASNIYGNGGSNHNSSYILSGTYFGWFNIINGLSNVDVYDRLVTGLNIGCRTEASISIRESFGGTNVTLSLVDGNGTTIASNTLTLTSSYQRITLSATQTTTDLRYIIHFNGTGGNGLDIVTENLLITQNCGPSVDATQFAAVSCHGGADGIANTALIPGASNVFNYIWSNGQTTSYASGLASGAHLVTITDGNSCVVVDTVIINEPPAISITLSPAISCDNNNNQALASVMGGTPNYSFQWDAATGNQTTANAVGLIPGTYCVAISDSNNCRDSACVTIAPINSLNSSNDTTICEGDTVQLFASGSNNYAWTPTTSLSNASIQNPLAFPPTTTTYYVTSTFPATNIIDNGDFEDGNVGFSSAYTLGTGGTWGQLSSPGTYAVNTNSNNTHNHFSSCTDHTSSTGNFMVVNGATTANQSVWCQTVNVTPNTNYQFSTWVTSVVASNPATLQFSINGVNIGSPFNASATTCDWDQFFTTWNSGTNTTATICIVNQNVGNGGNDFGLDDIEFIPICDLMDSVAVTVSPNPTITANNSVTICAYDSIHLFSNGGITYNWSGPNNFSSNVQNPTIPSAVSADSGLYIVTGTTALGCSDTASTHVIVNANPSIIISNTDVLCHGTNTGTATANVIGGDGNYNYLWSNNQVTQTAINLGQGSYQITATDGNGCSDTASVAINEPPLLTASLTATNVICNGDSNGTATINANGGVGGFTFSWSNSQTTSVATGLPAGLHYVTVTDNNNCKDTASITINEPPLLTASLTTTNITCTGDNNGTATINASGGVGGLTFSWSNGQTTSIATGLSEGQHFVTVIDNNNCRDTQHIVIDSPFKPTINPFISSIGTVTFTADLGTSVTISGGNNQTNQGVTYHWTGSSSDLTIGDNTAHETSVTSSILGNYTLTLIATATDSTACQDTGSITLNVIESICKMPTAFSPNNDGVNDFYRPLGLTNNSITMFRVYNRWGQEVYNGDNLENDGWDGRFQGVDQPTEVYLFVLVYKTGTNIEEKVRKGEFTLTR